VDTDEGAVKDALGDVQSVLVLGGTSEIGRAIASALARPRRASVVLAGRNLDQLESAGRALQEKGAGSVSTLEFDADDTDRHEAVVDKAVGMLGDLDVVVLAFGLLGDQSADEAGGSGAVRVARTNYVAAVSVGLIVARRLREQGHGTLVVLSSVAGERVRRSNFIYGSSKSGLDGFAQGLSAALAGSGASVLIVRPGFVRTKMTAGMAVPPLSTTADAVGAAVSTALRQGREIVWVPPVLRWVMVAVRHLPRPVFRRLRF
jgi:decaprenylphospho-beta-D-erythro-pentofuranosid-2-ulose 2-reductase